MTTETANRVRWYEWVYVIVLVVLFLYILLWGNRPRVGVLDLRKVAAAVGIDARIAADSQERQKVAQQKMGQLQSRMAELTLPLSRQLDEATGAKRDELLTQIAAIQKPILEVINRERVAVQRHRELALATFRQRVQPSVDKAARRRRLDVVIDPNLNVIYANRRVDITQEVIGDCKPVFKPDLPLIDPKLLPPQAAPAETEAAPPGP